MPNSSDEVKAATEAAKQARLKADDAKRAADAAGGADEALNATYQTLEAEAATLEAKATDLSQTPLQKETERARGKNKPKTEKEKAEFALKQNAKRLKDLGGDPNSILGTPKPEEPADDDEDDQTPVTRGELRRMQTQNAEKDAKEKAIDLADAIEDADERDYVKTLIESGKINVGTDPADAVRLARLAANSVKNTRIVEEINRKPQAREFSSGGGSPARTSGGAEPEFSAEEQTMMKPPYNLSKKAILEARAGIATGFPTTQ